MEQQELTILTDVNVSPLANLIRNYADYNLWANATLVNWLRTKPVEILAREVPSSFTTIKATMVHIWQTERYWLSVISGTEPNEAGPFNGAIEDAFVALAEQSDELADYVAGMASDEITENTKVISPWFQCDFQNFEYIMQCINHSTYHRGQIITIGRNLGFTDAPMTDYNFYNIHGK
ncbi:MAG: DinB family protein [Mucilaginibacter sp.]